MILFSWKITVIVSTYMAITANAIVFVDLYLSLTNPFFPRTKRMLSYYILMGLVTIWTITILINSISDNGTNINLYDPARNGSAITQLFIFLIVLSVFLTIPIFLTIYRLNKKGTSLKLRRLVIKRHLVFALVYSLRIMAVIFDQVGAGPNIDCLKSDKC